MRLFLVLAPVIWAPPSWGDDPYTWRRPVPGWRQSEESVTLENRGFKFEEAEFESHFRDEGMKFDGVDFDRSFCVYKLTFFSLFFRKGGMWLF